MPTPTMSPAIQPRVAPHSSHWPWNHGLFLWPTALALALCACGGEGGADAKDAATSCTGSACDPGVAKPDGDNGKSPTANDGGRSDGAMEVVPLEAQLQINGAVGLPCGECAVLIAQAQGGVEPYSYQWSDDALQGAGPHRVCPEEPTEYSVVVTDDSAIASPEFEQESMVVEASGKLDCSDEPEAWGGCFPQPEPPENPDDAMAAVECDWTETDPFLVDLGYPEQMPTSFGSPAPTGDEGFVPGKTYEVSYDQLLLILSIDKPVQVDVWGGDDPCHKGQKLGKLTLDGRWHQSFCFEAEKAWPYVRVDIDAGDTLVYLDLVAPVATVCKGCSKDD